MKIVIKDFREAFCEKGLGELARTVLRKGLLPGGVSRNRLDRLMFYFGGVLQAAGSPIEFRKSSYSVPKFLILQAQGLHTRSENNLAVFSTSSPTALQVSARILPYESFLFDGLNRFSEEI